MPSGSHLLLLLLLLLAYPIRCNQPMVVKWFKTGAVYEDTFFEKDLQAVDKAQEIIDAWNALQLSNTIHLNHPAVWVFNKGSR
jgi:hypothetical protein